MKSLIKQFIILSLIALPFGLAAQDSLEHIIEPAYDSLTSGYSDEQNLYDTTPSAFLRSVPDTTVERLKKDKDFLYANDPGYWKKKEETRNTSRLPAIIAFLQNPFVQGLGYLLLALLVVYIIYQVLVVNNLFIFSRSSRKKASISAEEEEALSDDLDEKISRAIGDQEFRAAVRYLYLKTLKVLNDKNLIRFHSEATNRDYLQQMRQSPGFKEFSFLTEAYEYVWYGEFEPSPLQFEMIRENFNYFIKS
ncbi:MAG: DUF4129 domain-containing protein [Flavitalea sp.]